MARAHLAAVLFVIASAAFVSAQEFEDEFPIVFDGTAIANDGMVSFSTGGPQVATDFLRTYVVNAGNPGGTDYQMDGFRDKAIEFFSSRFGVEIDRLDIPHDFEEPIPVGEDSMIIPMMWDRGMNARVSYFRHLTTHRQIPNGEALIGGYYLVVGNSGLPAGGTYKKELLPGQTSGYGQIVVINVCPVARQLYVFMCFGNSQRGYTGNLRIDFQNDIPNSPSLDLGWNTAAAPGLPAQMFPMHFTTHQKDKDRAVMLGPGSCHGMFYAVPQNSTMEVFNVISTLLCQFGPAPNYNGFEDHSGNYY